MIGSDLRLRIEEVELATISCAIRWRRMIEKLLHCVTLRVTIGMDVIKSFKSRRLEHFAIRGETKGIAPTHQKKLRSLLSYLDAAGSLEDIHALNLRLHKLKGDLKDRWAIDVKDGHRLVFRFDGDIHELDYMDYH